MYSVLQPQGWFSLPGLWECWRNGTCLKPRLADWEMLAFEFGPQKSALHLMSPSRVTTGQRCRETQWTAQHSLASNWLPAWNVIWALLGQLPTKMHSWSVQVCVNVWKKNTMTDGLDGHDCLTAKVVRSIHTLTSTRDCCVFRQHQALIFGGLLCCSELNKESQPQMDRDSLPPCCCVARKVV